MANFDGRAIRRVAESQGWSLSRVSGDHFVYKKPGVKGNLAIPDHRPVKEGLARQLVRDMGLSVDEFLRLAKK